MTDLSKTIVPKSDQFNTDDLITGPKTITITDVKPDLGSTEQPILISFKGDEGKPYKPCKSMRRVLVALWGKNGDTYTGRSMTLYRDPTVKWAGIEVGGIRISHMSHIDADTTLSLTQTRKNRAPYKVKRLVVEKERRPKVKEPGDIKQALDRIAGVSNLKMLELVRKALGGQTWAEEEISEIKEALAVARADINGDITDDSLFGEPASEEEKDES